MSKRRPPRPKPPHPNDPNHFKFNFDRVILARFANLDRLFGLTWKVVALAFAIALAGMWQGYQNHSLPTYFAFVLGALGLVFVVVVTETARSLRQYETKVVFAAVYVSVVVGSAIVPGLVLWQVYADWGLTGC